MKYFRPANLRTKLYYELLLSYFNWVKRRGFTRCYIWVCPPNQNGEDYILFCHPKTQQVPTQERLRQWYRKMVVQGHERGLVKRCQNLTDAHLRDAVDCTSLPYFSGDQWPQFAEIIIKELPKPPASTKRNAVANKNSHRKDKKKAKAPSGTRRGTRSTETELVGALANQRQRDALVKKLSIKMGSPEVRDNFMVIDFFDTCSHCQKFITYGKNKYTCKTCNEPLHTHWADCTFKKGIPKIKVCIWLVLPALEERSDC